MHAQALISLFVKSSLMLSILIKFSSSVHLTMPNIKVSFSHAQVWDQKYKTEQAAHFMNLLRPDVMVRKNIDLPWSWGLFSNDPNIPWDIIAAKVHYHVGWKLLMVLNYTSCVHNQVVCT